MTWAFEVVLFRQDGDDAYQVEVRRFDPELEDSGRRIFAQASFDLVALRACTTAADYGTKLADQLFADARIRQAYLDVRKATVDQQQPLRFQLVIDTSAVELHRIEWEKLRDPETRAWLLVNEHVWFSRFMPAELDRTLHLRSRELMRYLVYIASPAELASGWVDETGALLAPIDIDAEQRRAENAFGRAAVCDTTGTLQGLLDRLHEGCDVCYLACHGAAGDERKSPRLFFADPADPAKVATVRVADLAAGIADLEVRPTLMVIASCESAGAAGTTTASAALASLGPRLIAAGVHAVVAMQGKITMETAATFMQQLFCEVNQHGQLDRAVAHARSRVREALDAWMPVLFSRLRRGRVWAASGFSTKNELPWASIISATAKHQLVPVLGPGLLTPILGAPETLARDFAQAALNGIPYSGWQDLPRIAQLRAKMESPGHLRGEIEKLVRRRSWLRLGRPEDPKLPTRDLLKQAWEAERKRDTREAHSFLASLPLHVYVTANFDDFLEYALEDRGKRPISQVFRWRKRLPAYRPLEQELTEQEPLVFHLFGRLEQPESLVLTEDDFFDYLMHAQQPDALPSAIGAALSNDALLFLGFHVDDWRFRLAFRSILTEERQRDRSTDWKSIAAQVDPEDTGVLPMRRFLEKLFAGAKLETYWGQVGDLIGEYDAAWRKRS